jgi:hypothetical protein
MVEEQKKLNVEWTATAELQLLNVLEFWNNNNGSTKFSESLLKEINDRINFLRAYPLSSIKSSFSGVRMAAMGHFILFYRIEEDTLWVMSFWDNRRDPKELFRTIKNQLKNID